MVEDDKDIGAVFGWCDRVGVGIMKGVEEKGKRIGEEY